MTTATAPAAFIATCAAGHVVRAQTFAELQSGIYLVCPCGSRGRARSMNVAVVADRVCDARCTNAKGPTCSCSCSGHGHGSDHTLSA